MILIHSLQRSNQCGIKGTKRYVLFGDGSSNSSDTPSFRWLFFYNFMSLCFLPSSCCTINLVLLLWGPKATQYVPFLQHSQVINCSFSSFWPVTVLFQYSRLPGCITPPNRWPISYTSEHWCVLFLTYLTHDRWVYFIALVFYSQER